jgi:hypothetical protein
MPQRHTSGPAEFVFFYAAFFFTPADRAFFAAAHLFRVAAMILARPWALIRYLRRRLSFGLGDRLPPSSMERTAVI